ncbi:MAG TPA: lysylphosphatidylglycerol synthase transmembrane domain-containing protein [Anaeromyxobacteraceae bacterium]|nr:lysylphosphatidylglycerol synthase transmembrane domain-containing protein [Anaeromyxobacteraceae bacterium]
MKKRFIQTLFGLAISAAALTLTLRGERLDHIWANIVHADYVWLWPYLAILTVIHLMRTVRWGILLEPVAKVRFSRLNAVSAVGFMALMVLPFRLGEFARPYLIAERPNIRVSAALSSIVVERVADGLFTAVLLFVTLLAVPEGTAGLHAFRLAGVIVFLSFGSLLAFLILAYKNRPRAVRLTHRLLDPFSPRLAERAAGMMDAFIHGLRLVPSRRKVAFFFGLTVLYWAASGWGIQIFARSFNFHLGLLDAYTVLGGLVVGVMIPAGPGMVGTFQAATVGGLLLFAPNSKEPAIAFANALWFVQLAQQTLFGLVFLFSRHIQMTRILEAPAEVEEELENEEREYTHKEGASRERIANGRAR